METRMLCIGLLTKNNKTHIEQVLKNVEKYISIQKENEDLYFISYKVLIVDGNSTDGTYEICKKWCKDFTMCRKVVKQLNTYLPRPLALEQARNTYLEYFQPYFKKNTFLLILDADEVNASPLDEEGFKSCFKYSSWDFMGANQSDKYYDIWALRKEGCDYDCWEMYRKTKDISYVHKHNVKINSDNELIDVKSAFGGTGIYHTPLLKNLKYSSFTTEGKEQCEHVGLNLELLKRGGKLYINPRFINK